MKTFGATIRHMIIADGHYCASHCPQFKESGKFGVCRLFYDDLAKMQAGRTTVYHRCPDCFECENNARPTTTESKGPG